MSTTSRNAQTVYLELPALGINVRTGAQVQRPLPCAQIAALMRRERVSRSGLREILTSEDENLAAVQEEEIAA